MTLSKRWYALAAAVVLADQAVKALAARLAQPVVLIPGVLQLTYAENTGMAFSLLAGNSWLLGVFSLVCIAAGMLVLRRFRLGPVSRAGAMLMLGGAAGNMLDRLLNGYVIDMFEVLFVRFAVFNVADAALTVGTGLMAVSLLFCQEDWREKDGRTGDDADR